MKLTHPTDRPNYAILTLPDRSEVVYSYETPIALMNAATWETFRRPNSWGPTTGKHFNHYLRARGDAVTLSDDDFMSMLRGLFAQQGARVG